MRGGGAAGRRALACAAALALLALPLPALAEDRAATLADIRAELSELSGELARLQAELAPGPGAAARADAPDTLIDRVAALDRAVQRLTARTEELGFRIERVVADGTNRIDDIRFRLSEMDGGGVPDPSPPLGGGVGEGEGAPALPAAPQDRGPDGPFLAVGEQAAFDAASAALDRGDWAGAEALLAEFTDTFPTGPLTARAHIKRAEALERLDDPALAARAWLAGFTADEDGPQAAAALLGLGSALARLDQPEEACIMLDELATRFPASPEADLAADTRAEIGCP